MYRTGITVTPHVEINSQGEEVVTDFDLGGVGGYDSAYDNDYILDSEGRTHHRFENVEFNEDGYEEDFQNQDTAFLMKDLVGGEESYNAFTYWCYHNLPPQDIEAYDSLVDEAERTGDWGQFEETLQYLYQQYEEAGGNQFYEEDDDDEYQDNYNALAATVYDAVGGQPFYQNMLFWASENCANEFIDWYDECMETGDPDLVSQAVGSLYEMYTN